MKNKLVVNADVHDLFSFDKKIVVSVIDSDTGKIMKSYGGISSYHHSGDYKTWEVELRFKTTENDSRIKEITVKNDGSYKINSMMFNRPIPKSYIITSLDVIDRYTEEEKKRIELMNDIHNILERRCHEYIHFQKPILLALPSINKEVFVEYFTKDWFGVNDIINYRTDYIRMNTLSIDDLISVRSMLLK